MPEPKPVVFCGSSLDDLRAFPASARREAGYQLGRVQSGRIPDDMKAMSGLGTGVNEIRIRDRAGAFRVVYVATRPEALYVLHAFQKKTEATATRDVELVKSRMKQVLRRDP